jgi:membrane protein YdbS with pleckstrin-like domain
MVTRKQEFVLAFVGLAAVLIAFIALLYVNNTLALAAAGLAIVAMIMTIAFVYTEEEKLEGEMEQIRKDERKQRK